MRNQFPRMMAEAREDSSIPSQEWRTSGMTSGTQAVAGTGGLTLWRGEPSTSIDRYGSTFELIGVEESDLTPVLSGGSHLRKSIELARQELREGAPYLTHDEIFGE
jgi:hypothetical protein